MPSSDDHELLIRLKQTIDEYSGSTEVVLVVGPDESKQAIRLPLRIEASEDVLNSLDKLVGPGKVKLS
jgi:hypothetical protein